MSIKMLQLLVLDYPKIVTTVLLLVHDWYSSTVNDSQMEYWSVLERGMMSRSGEGRGGILCRESVCDDAKTRIVVGVVGVE